MKEEITIYEKDKIKVTNARAVFGDKTYSISNISAVELETVEPSRTGSALMLVSGIVLIILAIPSFISAFDQFNAARPDPNYAFVVLGLLLLGVGFLASRSGKPSYTVKFSSSSGEVKAMTSGDKESIKGIVDAINTAIIQKG